MQYKSSNLLYEEFKIYKKGGYLENYFDDADYAYIKDNLNPKFEVRPYQQQAINYFLYNFKPNRQPERHLMFNMATGAGKTLIMAANILYLYSLGYRQFIFFTRLSTIIEKTKDNFTNKSSSKYLFNDIIIMGNRQIKINVIDNLSDATRDNINIVFISAAGLHSNMMNPKENSLTLDDFAEEKIVLLADEAHNFQTKTRQNRSIDEHNWEGTISKVFEKNQENILLEYTATARLDDELVAEKYKEKLIYYYDLKQFREDGFSKEVHTLQIDAPVMERAMAAVIISQYRLKIAQKHHLTIKPVILFKANQINQPQNPEVLKGDNPQVVISKEFKENFHKVIDKLQGKDLEKYQNMQNPSLNLAFAYFKANHITLANLAEEIKNDFAPDKCLSVDEEKEIEQKQISLNNLEDLKNPIRAVFATEKLNEGWDVLNLFDIVRLYDKRDAKANRPGKGTVQEAQLIGRGARYCPFSLNGEDEKYKRKFDNDEDNEIRILEKLLFHSTTNPKYIDELNKALIDSGIKPERNVTKEIKVKDDIKKEELYINGLLFSNERIKKSETEQKTTFEFQHNAEKNKYTLSTGFSKEAKIFGSIKQLESQLAKIKKTFHIKDFGMPIVRTALAKHPQGNFANLLKLGKFASINEFVKDKLKNIQVEVEGRNEQIESLKPDEKLKITEFVLAKIFQHAKENYSKYKGNKEFTPKKISDIFQDKFIKLDENDERAKAHELSLEKKSWFAQNEIWGTSEEKAFISFFESKIPELEKTYKTILLFRNQRHFAIYSFDKGEKFECDFVLFLKKHNGENKIYQVFVEAKGDQFKDKNDLFNFSKEAWKQKFLREIKTQHRIDFKLENKEFELIGLDFYNEKQQSDFDKNFIDELLKNPYEK